MVRSTFRFHDELNDFLSREKRGLAITCPCARAATAKHMIEALGVPHTEVGCVKLNGEESAMDRLLSEGDVVEAWPHRPAAASIREGLPEPAPAFVADAHLGGLARLLRMAGFDTLYGNHFRGDEVAEIAAREIRIVLTRDRELLKRRDIEEGCYVRARKPQEQLREVFARYDLRRSMRPFSLCLHCNVRLHAVAKADVEAALPPSVRQQHEEFSTCPSCRRVFWPGSHWQRMRGILDAAADRTAQNLG